MTFFLSLCFIVIVFIRPQEWVWEWLEYLPFLDTIFVASLFAYVMEYNAGRIRIPRNVPQMHLIGWLIVAAAMSHVAHTYFAGLIGSLPMLLKPCFFTVLLITVIDSAPRLRAIARVIVISTCFMAASALSQAIRGYGFGGDPPDYVFSFTTGEWYTRTRYYGIFSDSNDLAQMLITALPLAFALPRRRSIASVLFGFAVVAFLLYGFSTTHSRGGMVALAVTAVVTFCLFLPARWYPTLMAIMMIGGVLVAPFAEAHMDESAHDRVAFWGQANTAFKRTPVFGVGLNMIADYIEGGRAPHNAYVLCYSETGIFGYSIWFALLFTGLLGVWRTRVAFDRPDNEDEAWLKRFAGQLMAATAGFAASDYFLGRAFVYPVFLLFALMAAVPVVADRLRPGIYSQLLLPRKDLLISTILAVASIAYIYVSILVLNRLSYAP